MLTVSILLLGAAFVCCVMNALGKCPEWIPLMLVIMWGLLTVLPR